MRRKHPRSGRRPERRHGLAKTGSGCHNDLRAFEHLVLRAADSGNSGDRGEGPNMLTLRNSKLEHQVKRSNASAWRFFFPGLRLLIVLTA